MTKHPIFTHIFTRSKGFLTALAFTAVFSCVGSAFAVDYTLTTRVKPTEAVFDGKTYTQLDSSDKIIVTSGNAQIWLTTSATLNCSVDISGKSYGSEKTGKLRMQMGASDVANFNGTVNLVGDTYIGSHGWQSNQGTLYFNSQITGAGALIVAPGRYSVVHLNNTTSANNYQGNTQIGSTDMYNNSGNTNYGGTIILDADEQIPDVLTAGSTCVGNLVLNSWDDASGRLTSTLDLNGHTETVNGLVSSDTLSVVTGAAGSKLIVGANNASSTYTANLQGAMHLEKIGSGTLTLSGANTFSGGTAITQGTVKLTGSGTLGTGNATIASGATVEIGTSETPWTWAGGVINGDGTFKVTGSGEFSMPLNKMQVGTNGSVIVDGAKLTLTNPTTNYQGKDIYINNGGTFAFDRTTDAYAGIYFNNTLNVYFDQNGGGTFGTGDSSSGGYMNIISNSTMTFTTNGGATNYLTGTNGINTHNYGVIFDVAKGTSADGKDLIVSARLWNGKNVVKNGAGTLVLTYANDYKGGTTINAGTVMLTGDGALGTGAVSVAAGSTLNVVIDSGAAKTWNGGTISGDGTLKVSGSGTFTITPAQMQISNTGSLIADGANVILNNDSSTDNANYSGAEIFINNGGTVTFARSGNKDQFWISNQTTITFDENGGGTFNAGDNHSINLVNNSQTRFVTNGGATNYIKGASGFNLHGQSLTFDVAKGTSESGIDLELSARLWNNQGVIKNGPGTMSITCNNTNNGYRGKTEINAGTLVLAGNGTFGAGTSAITVASGATLKFAADLVNTTVANPFSGTGTIVKDGTNTVVLTGTNTYTGDVTINGGSLDFLMNGTNKNLNVAKVSGSGDLVLRLASGNGDTRVPSIVNDGFTGAISLVQEGGANGNKINSNGQTFEGFKIKVNPGTSIYIQGNEFKADVSISGNGNSENRGALRVANTLSGNVTVAADANIGVDGTRTISSKIVSGAASGETTLFINGKTDGSTVTNNAGMGTFSGAISDGTAGSILGLWLVSNTQTFSGALTYTGATTIDPRATMVLTGANTSLADSREVNVNGTLNFTGYTGTEDMQINNLTGTNGTIIGTGKNLALTSDTESTFTGTIDAANLTISSGTFNLNGSTTGDVTVNPGAVFSGTAEIGGVLTVAADDSKLVMKLRGTDAAENDLLIVSGNLALSEGKVFLELADGSSLKGGDNFTVVLSGLNSEELADDFIANYVNAPIFTDLAYAPLTSGEFAGYYAITGSLDANAIPEPSAWLLLLLGAGLMYWQRRK